MASTSVFLFTGENTYALRHELSRWKRSFQEKYGIHNYAEHLGRDMTLSPLLDAVSSMPFIAEKRLVIIEGLPKVDRDEFASVLKEMYDGTILAIVEPKLDKRLGLVKDLEKTCDVKVFAPLSPIELRRWMIAEAQALGASLSPEIITTLLDVLGDDQWILSSELTKLCLYANTRPITREDVDLLAVPSGSQVIWTLTDLIGRGRQIDAVRFLRRRLERGEDAYGFWIVLLNMLKNLVLVWSAVQEGKSDERSITSATGLHFLSVRGLLSLARSLDFHRIRQLVDSAVETDRALKTGGLHFSADHPHEIIAVTERLILQTA